MKRPQSAVQPSKAQEEIYSPQIPQVKKPEKNELNKYSNRPNSSQQLQNISAVSVNFVKPIQIYNAPKAFYNDQEHLYQQQIILKREMHQISQENKILKTIQTQQRRYIRKVENVDVVQLSSSALLGMKSSGEGSIVPILKAKIRQQNDELEILKEDLANQYKSVKLTQMKEQEQQLKKYKDEVIRLSFLLKNALKINDTDLDNDNDIQDRMMKQIEVINNQRQEISDFKAIQNQQIEEFNQLKTELMKCQGLVSQLAVERAQLKKANEQLMVNMNPSYTIKKRDVVEIKLKQYIKECDVLKGELVVKEQKLIDVQRQLKDTLKDFKANSINNQRENLDLQESCERKDRHIQELQDRVYILDLMKQKSQVKTLENASYPKRFIPPTTYSDAFTQIPESQPVDLEFSNTKPVGQMQLKQITDKLHLNLYQYAVKIQEIKQYFGDSKYIKLKIIIDRLIYYPFYLDNDEAQSLGRVLVEQDRGKGTYMEIEAVQDINVILNRFTDIVGRYEIRNMQKEVIVEKEQEKKQEKTTSLKESLSASKIKSIEQAQTSPTYNQQRYDFKNIIDNKQVVSYSVLIQKDDEDINLQISPRSQINQSVRQITPSRALEDSQTVELTYSKTFSPSKFSINTNQYLAPPSMKIAEELSGLVDSTSVIQDNNENQTMEIPEIYESFQPESFEKDHDNTEKDNENKSYTYKTIEEEDEYDVQVDNEVHLDSDGILNKSQEIDVEDL